MAIAIGGCLRAHCGAQRHRDVRDISVNDRRRSSGRMYCGFCRLRRVVAHRHTARMMSLERLRSLLGPEAEHLSDAELDRIRACLYGWAKATFSWWRKQSRGRVPDSPDSHTPR